MKSVCLSNAMNLLSKKVINEWLPLIDNKNIDKDSLFLAEKIWSFLVDQKLIDTKQIDAVLCINIIVDYIKPLLKNPEICVGPYIGTLMLAVVNYCEYIKRNQNNKEGFHEKSKKT